MVQLSYSMRILGEVTDMLSDGSEHDTSSLSTGQYSLIAPTYVGSIILFVAVLNYVYGSGGL